MIDPRNDGQLLFYDQIVPRSTLLGYLNADHWAIAVPIVRDAAAARLLVDRNAFPREILLEAILKQIEEDLIATGRVTTSGPVADGLQAIAWPQLDPLGERDQPGALRGIGQLRTTPISSPSTPRPAGSGRTDGQASDARDRARARS
jgi:hypothetical protein